MMEPGKAGSRFMKEAVFRSLGKESRRTERGPGFGLDNAVLRLGGGRVMLLTVDPVSLIPALGVELSAWLSSHLIASDYTTSGNGPELATFCYNFPESTSARDAGAYVKAIGDACKRLGVAIVAGHTGSYPGSSFTVIGAGSMFGFSGKGRYVDPTMMSEGDVVFMTKHAAIEATFSLALSYPKFTRRSVGRASFNTAASMVRLCSTVDDALSAAEAGLGKDAVSSMHDATEGGVIGALREMALAAGKAVFVDADSIPVSEAAKDVCSAFGIDPLTSLGEGALLITCNPRHALALQRHFEGSKTNLTRIGHVSRGSGLWMSTGGGPPRRTTPQPDGYWSAYEHSQATALS